MQQHKAENANSVYIFVHIPKTAGSTLRPIVRRQFQAKTVYQIKRFASIADEFGSMSPERRAQIRLVLGHIPFGAHYHLPNPAVYITMLRDPVDRVLSHYFHALRNPQSPFYKEIQSMNVGDFVASGLSGDVENRMTHILTGQWVHHLADQQQACTQTQYEQAIQNLETWFPVIGLSERFDESLLLMKQLYQWKNIYYGKRNVTPDRPLRQDIDKASIAVIEEFNQFDRQLYTYACQKFDALVEQQGESFKRQLHNFQLLNKPIQMFYASYDRLYQQTLRQPWLRKLAGQKLKNMAQLQNE